MREKVVKLVKNTREAPAIHCMSYPGKMVKKLPQTYSSSLPPPASTRINKLWGGGGATKRPLKLVRFGWGKSERAPHKRHGHRQN